jgi:enamine deaminase RidA (YjgF/YER057c/UK114 family)
LTGSQNLRRVPARGAWAEQLAYSRALIAGPTVHVSGTLPVDDEGRLVGGDDAYLQACRVFDLIERALVAAGAALDRVVRLRLYLREAGDLDAVARAQRERFADIRPVCTITVCALAFPQFRVQADAEAWTG